jgi:peptidoglycan hydrolase-like protein with peptidoglycan-binding domain
MGKVAIFLSLFFFGLSFWSCESVNYVKNELAGIGKPEGGSEEVVPNNSNQDNIYKVQKRLIELGYEPGPADGIMGKMTKKAIKKFQKDNDLPPTGKIDNDTKNKLGA